MNTAEMYARKLSQSLIIEIHMAGNINHQVLLHSAEDLERIKAESIEHWQEAGYDHEEDDTQIWNTNGELIWSYHTHWEAQRDAVIGIVFNDSDNNDDAPDDGEVYPAVLGAYRSRYPAILMLPSTHDISLDAINVDQLMDSIPDRASPSDEDDF